MRPHPATSPPAIQQLAPPLADRLFAAINFARAAGDLGLTYFKSQRFDIQTKGDGSPVTIADQRCEQLLRESIESAFPDDSILGEEFPEKVGPSGYRWIIDPIDGTASFIHGVPLYGVLVAVERDRKSCVGVIHMPALDETVFAATGAGAWHTVSGSTPTPARVSAAAPLKSSLVCITGWEYFVNYGHGPLLAKLAGSCKRLRGWSDCYAHVLVATGRADAVVEPGMHPWDNAASAVIIPEAGGCFTDFAGVHTAHSNNALITNGKIHDELLKLIAS